MVGKILIVDDVATNRILMKVKLAAAGYQPLLAADGQSALLIAARERPDIVLLDLMLPDLSGLEVLHRLREMPELRSVPIVMFSATFDSEAQAQAFRLGADEFLAKPVDDQTLLARIRSFMRARDQIDALASQDSGIAILGLAEPKSSFHHPGVIGIITARPETALKLQREISRFLTDRILVINPADALQDPLNPTATPDVYLIDANLSGASNGLRLMSELRSRSRSRHAAICLLDPHERGFSPSVAFDLGANDLVNVTAPAEELAMRLMRLLTRKRESDRLRATVQDGLRLAMIDPLTGLHNRRYGLAQLNAIAVEAASAERSFAVMVADLDRFKSVNDHFGHAAGDAVLIEVAQRLALNLRLGDLVARIGGEEFLIVLPDTSLQEAQDIAERLCHAVDARPIALTAETERTITVSIGLALSTPDQIDRGVTEIVERADRALMLAKTAGRNQVTVGRSAA